ncbi:MAG TPA: TfoX/Sxy family protein [Saprospiraceae bacterium]|nr:TfoX/Sxy family protein [Saprospiraceae bacterium]
MAYNEIIADKIRAALAGNQNLIEKKMFGGIAFMIDDKMCIGVNNDDIMLRCEKEETAQLLKMKGAKVFDLSGGRPMEGWLLVSPEGTQTQQDFDWWVNKAIEGNKNAVAAPKKKR